MSSTTFGMRSAVGGVPVGLDAAGARTWRIAAISLLSVRFIQGFIYWGGGSRRFIYAPSKLDPNAPHWMANKFQTAMPGALLGTEHVISFMLQHFWVLYAGVLLFSAAELMAGAMLMTGLFTRAAALVSMGFSVVLMLMFGWQGATCIDEWTMAAANLAIGTTLLLGGGGAYSLDNVLLRRPLLAGRGWLRWAGGSLPLPQSERGFTGLALGLFAFVVVFDVSTYSYYRGSVLTAFHGGPVSPTKHHLTLDHATVAADGAVRFHVYLDGGTPEEPAHVMKAELLGADGRVLERWDGSVLAGARIRNDYLYNKFGAGPYGLVAEMGAKATIELPGSGAASGATRLLLTGVSGRSFSAGVTRD